MMAGTSPRGPLTRIETSLLFADPLQRPLESKVRCGG
jgi:hypothetical protein